MAKLDPNTRRVLLVIAGFVPGLGQLIAGRLARGLVCALLASTCTWLVLVDHYVFEPFLNAQVRWLLVGVAVAAYLLSLADTLYLAKVRYSRAGQRQRELHFERGNLAVMQGRLSEAAEHYRRVIHDDPSDVNALLKLAKVELLEGRPAKARMHLQECRHLDDADQWDYEIEAAMAETDELKANS